ncbi:MAG: hypothetical protein KDD14_10810 [Saprospiraceae bacterium]|nr:hypothetical protein [Saprospiraceae bacterium]
MKKKQFKQLAISLSAGAIVGYAGMQMGRSLGDFIPTAGATQKLLTLAVALFATWFALAFHELAHLLTGLAQGFRFQLFVAGFFGVRRHPENDTIQLYFNTDMQLFGGVAATLPRAQTNDLARRFARVVLAGPLGSLSLVLLGSLTTWALSDGASLSIRYLAYFSLVSAVVSAALFLATTLPRRTGMFFTDRARYFRLISGGKTAQIEQAMLELIAFFQAGKPLEAIDMAQVDLIREDPDYALYADYYAFYHHMATGNTQKALGAAERLSQLADTMPVAFRAEFWKEVCFAAAYLRQDAAAANEWWAKIERQLAKRGDVPVLRLKAALHLVNGRMEEARRLARQGLDQLAQKTMRNGSEQLEFRLLEALAQ